MRVYKHKNPPILQDEINIIVTYYNNGIDCAEIGRKLGRDETRRAFVQN
jgi:hypothetical protein